ncbi:hypothetical protein GOB48_04380, partial [Sinorhizobium meliloti]|nr:hypothetical protein [Sinorhizobium meliloti]
AFRWGRHHLGIRGRLFLGIGGRDHFGIRGRIASEFAPTTNAHHVPEPVAPINALVSSSHRKTCRITESRAGSCACAGSKRAKFTCTIPLTVICWNDQEDHG